MRSLGDVFSLVFEFYHFSLHVVNCYIKSLSCDCRREHTELPFVSACVGQDSGQSIINAGDSCHVERPIVSVESVTADTHCLKHSASSNT